MSSKNSSDFVLLSDLINVLKDKEYYQTFAKTIAMTSNSKNPIPSDDDLVKEMFRYFIQTNILQIYHENALANLDVIEAEISNRISKSSKITEDKIRKNLWDNEIYFEIKELKRLYANKCIVFPSSLLTELSKLSK